MASLGIATINVLARTTQFENSLKRSIKRIGVSTAAILGGVAAGNFLQGALQNSIDLEKQIKQIQTLLQAPMDRGFIQEFSAEKIRALSNEIGIAASDVADSLYLILSSGISAADAFDTLRAAAGTAVSTNSDLKLVVDFTTSAVNAYGDSLDKVTGRAVDAARANDILFKALQYGKGSMNDFAKYVSTAIPIAAQLGVSLDQLASVAAVNTTVGASARKVFTGLKVSMQELVDPTKNAGKAFLEITGKTFPEFIKQGNTLEQAYKRLAEGVKGGAGNLTNLGGAKEGLLAVQQLITLYQQIPKVVEGVEASEGEAARAADLVNQSLSRQIDFLVVRFQNFKGQVGEWMAPVVGRALVALDELRVKFNEVWPDLKQQIMGFVESASAAAAMFWDSFSVPILFAIDALRNVDWAGLSAVMQSVFTGMIAGAMPLISTFLGISYIISGVMQALAPLVAVLNQMKPVIAGITAAVVAYRLSWLLVASAVRVAMLATAAWQVVTKVAAGTMALFRTAILLWQVATGKATLTQWKLNAALVANPIGIVIGLVAGLAAAFVYGWKTSEKFRNFVVGAWNAIKDGTLTAISVILDAIYIWATTPVRLMERLLAAASKLPKWLGGGVADGAHEAVANILNGIESMKASLDGLIAKAKEADWALSQVGGSVSMTGGNKLPPGAKLYMDKINKNAGGGAPSIPTLSGGGSYDPFASDSAGKSAKEAAKKIKDAMKRIGADLDRIAKNTSKQTIDAIKNNFETLYKDMKDGKVSKKIIKQAKAMEKKLLDIAKKRDSLGVMYQGQKRSLSDMRDILKDLIDDAKQFTDSIKGTVNALGDVTQESRGFKNTFLGIRNQLRYAVIATKEFNANILRLRQMGLNDTNLRQLIEAGPEAAGQAARILAASGQAGVNEINNLQAQLTQAGNQLAQQGYDAFHKQGIAMAQGLVKGLESQEAALLKQMDKLGDRIAAQFKKKLGIKSPSKVFEGLGEMLPLGLSKGIDSGIGVVNKASQNMVDASITFGPGAIAINGVQDPAAAKRAGILAGAGIQDTLAQKQTARVLDGIG